MFLLKYYGYVLYTLLLIILPWYLSIKICLFTHPHLATCFHVMQSTYFLYQLTTLPHFALYIIYIQDALDFLYIATGFFISICVIINIYTMYIEYIKFSLFYNVNMLICKDIFYNVKGKKFGVNYFVAGIFCLLKLFGGTRESFMICCFPPLYYCNK